MSTTDSLPVGFLAYGEVVMAVPARSGDLTHRRAARWIPDPDPAPAADAAAARTLPTAAATINAPRSGQTLIRAACELEPDPGETTATIGWRDNDFAQMSAGWANHLYHAVPCPDERCFPGGYPR